MTNFNEFLFRIYPEFLFDRTQMIYPLKNRKIKILLDAKQTVVVKFLRWPFIWQIISNIRGIRNDYEHARICNCEH